MNPEFIQWLEKQTYNGFIIKEKLFYSFTNDAYDNDYNSDWWDIIYTR